MRFLKSFLSLALCLTMSYAFSQVDLTNGLQAYYPFNGNANDASGHGNNAGVNNAILTSDYFGNPNRAYYFDGASSAQSTTLCTGSLGDPIVNITFGSGNNPGNPLNIIVPEASTTYNFTSVYENPAYPIPLDGSYTITNNIPANLNWFQGATDHTGDGNGYMAFFNANPVPGEFYKQTVSNLCPGTSYQFSAWLANVLDPARMSGVLPDVTFRIEKTDGTLIASYKTGDIPQTSSMTWNQYGFFFTTPTNVSSVVLKMVNTNIGGVEQPGNDFALDGITFRACTAQLTASFSSETLQNTLQVCPNESFKLYGDTNPLTANSDYLWQVSSDNGITWSDLPNSNKSSLSLIAPSQAATTLLYRMLSAQKGNINSRNCRGASNTVALNVSGLCTVNALPCTNWYYNTNETGAFRAGDLDITGHAITIEASINRTLPYNRPDGDTTLDGDVVSKHRDEKDVNYLLRSNRCEITTTNGHFRTPPVCRIELNKTYHVAMTYDGQTLKFYRNGYLMSSIPATGELITNNYELTVGSLAYQPGFDYTAFKGYINNVRIWNTTRTQNQLKSYMDSTLPNPATQSGLLAYYLFDNLNNKQGNTVWDGNLINGAVINQTNPTCDAFVADSCGASPVVTPIVTASFSAPDTVCVNTPFTLTNTTVGSNTTYWNFCTPDLSAKPVITNLGSLESNLNFPVYTDYVLVDGNYYMFLVNNNAGGSILRLDFGKSLLNTPAVIRLNSVSTYLSGNTEGIQLVQNNGRWYAIVVGGDPQSFNFSQILKLDFGTDITNASPSVTDWGNPGNLLNYPHELYVFKENNRWYGFTANTYSNNVVKFDFGTDFSASPVASVFLSSFLNYPVGLYAYSQNGSRYLFVVNAGTSNATSTLVRLDFNSSYTNTPAINNLGNLGGNLGAYDFTVNETCGQLTGMSVRANDHVIARFTFSNADITQTPVFVDTITSGQLQFPHSFSKPYHEGSDTYFFIPNAFNNTLSRLQIAGCKAAVPAGSNNTNPGTISYNAPGTYTISLVADEGLPTQAFACKSVLVILPPKQAPPKDTSFCEGSSIRLAVYSPNGKYLWNTGSTDSAINISQPGKYWVQINNSSGCGVTDSFNVSLKTNPVVNLGRDTGLCKNGTLLLNAGNSGSTFIWQDGSTKSTYTATTGGTYYVTVTNTNKCSKADTIKIADYASPVLSGLADAKICLGNAAQLSVTANGNGNLYSWTPGSTLNSPSVSNPVAKPLDTTDYTVMVINTNGCISKDTATVFVLPKPVIVSIADTGFCVGGSVILRTTVSNAASYTWSPSTGLDNPSLLSPKAAPATTTSYIMTAKNDGCSISDTVKLTVHALPSVNAGSDTLVCGNTSIQLSATGGNQYHWSPATGLSNPNIATPVALINSSVTYTVTGTDKNGCINTDMVQILNRAQTLFTAGASSPLVCAGDSVLLTASGGNTYSWQPSRSVFHPADSSTYATPTTSTIYSVTISDQQCKISETRDIAVTVNPIPQISIAKSNDIDCRTREATLTASGAASFTWSPTVTGEGADMSTVKVSPEETTLYEVIAASDKGCTSTDTITVKVNSNLENQYPIASAFSPNGDGINDCFGVESWNVMKVDLQIYDRWGVLLFHSTNPQNVCWDGRYKNKNQLDGTYVYKIYAVTACGIINKAGTFVLIRATR